jgi:2-amino-4-hydroxy-6-hydroxymethyldihydropteridine diphosphokinase
MNTAWVGLGSNLGASVRVLEAAVHRIGALEATRLHGVSPAYRTSPWGGVSQPEFVNAVLAVDTEQAPRQLLENLLQIEKDLGRRRDGKRWGPRLIDLDLLVFADSRLNEPGLVVPHPHLHERAFVLAPLNDLAADLQVPGRGRVGDLLARLDPSDLDGLCLMADWNGSAWNIIESEVS